MEIKTDGRRLKDAIDGIAGGADLGDIGDEHRLALAQAFASVVRIVDLQSVPDREFTLGATVNAADLDAFDRAYSQFEEGSKKQPPESVELITLSFYVGRKVEPPEVEAPYVSEHVDDVDRERQEARAQADDAEAERIRELLNR